MPDRPEPIRTNTKLDERGRKSGMPITPTGVKAGGFIFVAGLDPLDPETGLFVEGDIRTQTRAVLENFRRIVESAGSSLENVVMVEVFLQNMDDFDAMNEVYREFFGDFHPARRTTGADLYHRKTHGQLIEISGFAYLPEA